MLVEYVDYPTRKHIFSKGNEQDEGRCAQTRLKTAAWNISFAGTMVPSEVICLPS
jgi:hypothetical protein